MNSATTVSVFHGDGREEKLAYEHYLQLYNTTKEMCGCDYIAPPSEVFNHHALDTGIIDAKTEALSEIQEQISLLLEDEEWGATLGTAKKRKLTRRIIEQLITTQISELRAVKEPTKLFKPRVLTSEQRESFSAGKLSDLIALDKMQHEDSIREHRAAAIVRNSFGKSFRDVCQGRSQETYETIPPRDIVKHFIEAKLLYMDDAAKGKLTERIGRLDGKLTEVQAVDAVERLYKALEIAGMHFHSSEKKSKLLQAVASHIGEQSRAVLSTLPQRFHEPTALDGDYSYESIVSSVNRVRNTQNVFTTREEQQKFFVFRQQGGNQPLGGNSTGAQGSSQGGSHPPIQEFEPKLTDPINKWYKTSLCGYHYRNGPYTTTPVNSHTNENCKRNKSMFFNKQYGELVEKLKWGSKKQ